MGPQDVGESGEEVFIWEHAGPIIPLHCCNQGSPESSSADTSSGLLGSAARCLPPQLEYWMLLNLSDSAMLTPYVKPGVCGGEEEGTVRMGESWLEAWMGGQGAVEKHFG